MPEGFPKLEELARRLKAQSRNERDRVAAVIRQFRGFKVELAPQQGVNESGVAPLENFLFESKSGHCEFFASTAAILFRAMGMPSRLVAGFRVNRDSRRQVISVRNTDAHAWVEVWTKERGWLPLDPTPVIPYSGNSWDEWLELYDGVSTFWQRYIVSYELDASDLRRFWLGMREWLPVFFASLLLLSILLVLRALYPYWRKRQEPRERVRRARERFKTSLPASLEQKYLSLRFGRKEPDAKEIKEFILAAEDLKESLPKPDTYQGRY